MPEGHDQQRIFELCFHGGGPVDEHERTRELMALLLGDETSEPAVLAQILLRDAVSD